MRTKSTIVFDGQHLPGGPGSVLDEAGCGPDVTLLRTYKRYPNKPAWVTLDTTDERLRVLITLLFKLRIEWNEVRWNYFTKKERENAPLLVMTSLQGQQIFAGPRVRTKYDLTHACKTCGAGALQTSPLMIDVDDVPKLKRRRAIQTMFANTIVDEQLAWHLETMNLKGLSFQRVESKRSTLLPDKIAHPPKPAKLRWKQMLADRSMPRFSPASVGVPREFPCTSCEKSGHIGWLEAPPQLAYRASDLKDIDDVMTTWELFGNPGFREKLIESILPYPWFLVTPKVMHAFRKAGVTNIHFLPIRIVDGVD